MNSEKTKAFVDSFWDGEILPTLQRYIEIPNQSPLFDPDWERNGFMKQAVNLARSWAERQNIKGCRIEVVSEPGRTPLILIEVDGAGDESVLLYGHLDKQPAMVGWDEDLGPWNPVLRDGKLYGRGGADDGYAIFACVAAVKALQEQNAKHPRLVVLIECCEESGSVDLPYYVEKLAPRIGTPALIVCLDSGCGDYEGLWTTASLRGNIIGNLNVEILTEGVHSGDASGLVPSTFRIMRKLLDRIEDTETGEILPEWLSVEIPENRIAETRRNAENLGEEVYKKFPFVAGARPMGNGAFELLLNGTWRPTLSITGQHGIPDIVQGGNVLLPRLALKLSIRTPPTLDVTPLPEKLKELFEADPPYGAKVTFDGEKGGSGWDAPNLEPWLAKAIETASQNFFGHSASSMGEGGSIPFMAMLSERFPQAQFLVTGVLGPRSNAHGPNEFLHIGMAKNLTASVAHIIADFMKA
jgi:Acetylornithine deacetylase/Succinyl-diaminopimelate desuccinylase and related deacylases